MTPIHYTLSNGAVIAIDLEAIPDEARWLTMEPSKEGPFVVSWRGAMPSFDCDDLCWYGDASYNVLSAPTVFGTATHLPPWSECLIDLEEVRNQAEQRVGRLAATALMDEPDDGPPRLYDVIETSDGLRWWLLEAPTDIHRLWRGWRPRNGAMGLFDDPGRCLRVARGVYDIREAVRLMGES